VEALAARNPSRYGAGHRYSLSDPRFLLRVVTEEWRVFKDQRAVTADWLGPEGGRTSPPLM